MVAPAFDVQKARSQFPSLASGYIFADNAGGSQAAQQVIERITDYFINSNVQLGADYSFGQLATQRVLIDAPKEAARLFNAASPDEIVFGSSSTLNLENLARGLEPNMKEGDEFIITGEHEGSWRFVDSTCILLKLTPSHSQQRSLEEVGC